MKEHRTARKSLAEVREILARFEASGLTLKAFSDQEQIPYSRLMHYRKRIKQATESGQPSTCDFVQLLPVPKSSDPVSVIEIHCGVFRVTVHPGHNTGLLGSVLEILKHHA